MEKALRTALTSPVWTDICMVSFKLSDCATLRLPLSAPSGPLPPPSGLFTLQRSTHQDIYTPWRAASP